MKETFEDWLEKIHPLETSLVWEVEPRCDICGRQPCLSSCFDGRTLSACCHGTVSKIPIKKLIGCWKEARKLWEQNQDLLLERSAKAEPTPIVLEWEEISENVYRAFYGMWIIQIDRRNHNSAWAWKIWAENCNASPLSSSDRFLWVEGVKANATCFVECIASSTQTHEGGETL